jgi:quercetin dioxygenase-like cupin family protein
MAYPGKTINQPVAGEHAEFIQTSATTDGKLLEMEVHMDPHGFVTVEHTHPFSEETFKILKGTITMSVNGKTSTVPSGETRVVPPGTPHQWFNKSDEEAAVRVEFRPASRIEYLFENGAGLAVDGKVNKKSGLPNFWQIMVFGKAYAPDMRMVKPPWWLQRIMFFFFVPIAKLLGYRAEYPKYTN